MQTTRYFIRPDTVQRALDRAHLTHGRFADHLGMSRSYWSQVFHRHRHLTPTTRQLLLASRYLKHVDEDELWDIEAEQGEEAAP